MRIEDEGAMVLLEETRRDPSCSSSRAERTRATYTRATVRPRTLEARCFPILS